MAVSSKEMAELDRAAERMGIPRLLLMENAGAAVARRLVGRFGPCRVLVLAGTGNNGGDGMVTARHLRNLGCEVELVLVGDPGGIRTEEARTNWRIVSAMKGVGKALYSSLRDLRGRMERADVVVDAMLGTGVRGELREPVLSIVRELNSSGKPVVAVDAPTGLDPSTGRICGEAVRAVMTVTFHAPKSGFAGRDEYTGQVWVEDIGLPKELEAEVLGRKLEGAWGGPLLVSACLLGVNCRYDGGNSLSEKVIQKISGIFFLPVCPEILGGLPTPRAPNWFVGGAGKEVVEGRARVMNEEGKDVTENFLRGAREVLGLAQKFRVRRAILKSGSPSCGVGWVKVRGEKIIGDGVMTALLRQHGVEVISDEEV
jgi:hydroxyethylthiazole kinase-like uncharacterized protein yjeF